MTEMFFHTLRPHVLLRLSARLLSCAQMWSRLHFAEPPNLTGGSLSYASAQPESNVLQNLL